MHDDNAENTPLTKKQKGGKDIENTPQTRKQKSQGYWQSMKRGKKEDEAKTTKVNLQRKRQRQELDNTRFEMIPMCGLQLKVPLGLQPYPTQKLMMVKILTGLNANQNIIAESPTGSGKTLALLASTCAWLLKYKEQRRELRASCPKHSVPIPENKQGNTSQLEVSQEIEILEEGQCCVDNDKCKETYENELHRDFVSCHTTPKETKAEPKKPDSPPCHCPPKVRIYYGTRTHKQIGQVVKEFRRLPYIGIIKHTILASREQSCINDQARASGNVTSFCKELLTDGGLGCTFKTNIRSHKLEVPYSMREHVEKHTETVFDIEDLVDGLKLGRPSICPYFTSTRILTSDADIVFTPFTYLVDPIIRESSDVHLKNSIVILDEAHNIEDTCREGASFTFTEREIAEAYLSFRTKAELLKNALNDTFKTTVGNDRYDELNDYYGNLEYISNFISSIWSWFTEVSEPARYCVMDPFSHQKNLNLGWAYIADSLIQPTKERRLYFKSGSAEQMKIMEAFKTVCSAAGPEQAEWLVKYKPNGSAIVMVEKWLYFSDYFQSDKFRNMYRLNVCMQKVNTEFKNTSTLNISASSYDSNLSQGPKNINYTTAESIWFDADAGPYNMKAIDPGHNTSISFWCMSPAPTFLHAFAEARNVILASGTLCPIETLKTELGIPFKIEVEGKQVIPNERIFASVVSVGPAGVPLAITKSRIDRNPEMLDEVAQIIKDVCLSVPRGILCFVPSYSMIHQIKRSLEKGHIYKELIKKKVVLEEPKTSSLLGHVVKKYEDVLNSPRLYGSAVDGALMLAVFRGKISEGIDFADDKARAVITVGIPYPNFGDQQVTEKKKYNSENSAHMGILNGDNWYATQAYRALNQALGRCLRHKNDWGALILIDERLISQARGYERCRNSSSANSAKVSRWIRDQLRVFQDYNNFSRSLQQFLATMKKDDIPDALTERCVQTLVD